MTSTRIPPTMAALVVALAGAATIAGAWFFELVLKLKPCPLCLEQRVPYYIGDSARAGRRVCGVAQARRAHLVTGGLARARAA